MEGAQTIHVENLLTAAFALHVKMSARTTDKFPSSNTEDMNERTTLRTNTQCEEPTLYKERTLYNTRNYTKHKRCTEPKHDDAYSPRLSLSARLRLPRVAL